jgi:hypothetical protein
MSYRTSPVVAGIAPVLPEPLDGATVGNVGSGFTKSKFARLTSKL